MPEVPLFASRSRVPAGVFFRGLVLFVVRLAAGSLADDADQDGYGDDRNDY